MPTVQSGWEKTWVFAVCFHAPTLVAPISAGRANRSLRRAQSAPYSERINPTQDTNAPVGKPRLAQGVSSES